MSDRSVRSTSLYRALRDLNGDLEPCDILEMARANIERKWAVIEAEREAREQAEQQAEQQARQEAERAAKLQEVMAALENNINATIIIHDGEITIEETGEEEEESTGFRNPGEARERLKLWMAASAFRAGETSERGGSYVWPFSAGEVAKLLGCTPPTVYNWLNGTRSPQRFYMLHLQAMMNSYTYRQLRQMLRNGHTVTCSD